MFPCRLTDTLQGRGAPLVWVGIKTLMASLMLWAKYDGRRKGAINWITRKELDQFWGKSHLFMTRH